MMRVGQKYPGYPRTSRGPGQPHSRHSRGSPRSSRGHSSTHRHRSTDYKEAMNRQLKKMQRSMSTGTDWAREKWGYLHLPHHHHHRYQDEDSGEHSEEEGSETPPTPPFSPRGRHKRYSDKVIFWLSNISSDHLFFSGSWDITIHRWKFWHFCWKKISKKITDGSYHFWQLRVVYFLSEKFLPSQSQMYGAYTAGIRYEVRQEF